MSDPLAMDAEPQPVLATRLSEMGLKVIGFLYFGWYMGGLVILTSGWFSASEQVQVSGWGDCVFLSLAGLLTLLIVRRDFRWEDLAPAITFTLLASATVEMIGVKTGLPFGEYMYTDRLGARIGGIPWIVPVSWLILVINAYIICSVLVVPREGKMTRDSLILLILITSVVVTLVDLNLEPVSVNVQQYWFWMERDRAFYGVPRINFFGWFSVSLVLVSALTHMLDPRQWKLSTAWGSLLLLGSIQVFFALMNWQAHQYAPVLVALNLVGILAIGLTYLCGK